MSYWFLPGIRKNFPALARNVFFYSFMIMMAYTLMSFTRPSSPEYFYSQKYSDSSQPQQTDSSKMFADLFSSSPFQQSAASKGSFNINPAAMSFVTSYIRQHGNNLDDMKVWGKPYFNLYDRILSQFGLPTGLKYLSVIESNLNAYAVSWAGAAGPWQLMPATAQEHGLRVTRYYDERTDYTRSTYAAARILRELYTQYGDWLLVIAAYNAGSGNVDRAIKKSGSNNFWELQYYLPEETRNHVKKFIATHYYFEGAGGITTSTVSEIKSNYAADVFSNSNNAGVENENNASISIYGKYNSVVIANKMMIDITEFNTLNPDIDKKLSAGEIYSLTIPVDKVELFQSKKLEILKESVQLLLSPPSAGDTGTN